MSTSDLTALGWPLLLVLLPFLAILIWALVDVIRRPESQMRYLPKWAWLLIVLLGNTLGQLVYLFIGRDNSAPAQPTSGASAEGARDAADTLYGTRTPGQRP